MLLQQSPSLLNSKVLTFFIILSISVIYSQNNLASNIFTCKDKNGATLYTDSPDKDPNCINPKIKKLKELTIVPKGVNPNTLNNTNTTFKRTSDNQGNNDIDESNYYTNLNFTTPASGESINRCGGVLEIKFTVEPSLYAGDMVELYIDGSRFGTTTGNSFTINNMTRGNHNAELRIVRDGDVQKKSNTYFNFLRNCARAG